jgi:uncharacterized membrane protein
MRAGYLDALRGLAVVWMIIFHAAYDMKMLGFIDWNFAQGFWWVFPRFIAWTFLFCVGASLNYTHSGRTNWQHLKIRSLKLAAAALVISLSTYIMFPQQWIFFGTLHCILVGSLIATPLVHHRKLALLIMLIVMMLQYLFGFDIKWVSSVVQRPSMDFIPIYPWIWAILFGLLTGPYLSKIRQLQEFPTPKWLRFLGTHSLKIYLIHQPLIFGTLWVIQALI